MNIDTRQTFRSGTWRCVKQGGLCHIVSPEGIRIAATAAKPGTGIAGADAFGVCDAPVPAGACVQHMRFGFRSNGFFAAEPGAHLAIGIRGRWRKDDPSTTSFDGCLMGRGIIIGNVSGAPNGCAEAPVVQIESFRRDGNELVSGSGSPCLLDDVDYCVELHCDDRNRIGYRLTDAATQILAEYRVDDTGANIPADLGGWWITHVFSDTNAAAEWSIDFVDLTVEWEPC